MLILPAQSLSGLFHILFPRSLLVFCQIPSFPQFWTSHPPPTLAFPYPILSPCSPPLSGGSFRARQSLYLWVHRESTLQTSNDPDALSGSTNTHTCKDNMHVRVETYAPCFSRYVSNRSRNRVGQMLKKHHRDTGQRARTIFTVKIKGWKIERWRGGRPSGEEGESVRCSSD